MVIKNGALRLKQGLRRCGLLFMVFWGLFLSLSELSHAKEVASKPRIGVLLNDGGEAGYSPYPWYAIRKNYGEVITQYGGIPIYIGHDTTTLEDYLSLLDGIVLTGGDFELPKEVYTTGLHHTADLKKYPRAAMELKLIKLAYQRNIPVLGICAGMQEMNVALGGTLTSNLKKTFNITTEHRNENREKIQHKVTIEPNTQLYHIVKNAKFGVNSNHREGLKEVSPVLNINARATDGVVEGIEAPKKQFFIGVMWHPEFQLNKEEEKLWQAFLDAATKYQATRA